MLDASDASQVELALAQIEAKGELVGAVLSAGTITITPFLELTADQWRATMRDNTESVFTCIHAVAKRMVARQVPGSIVAVASVAGRGPRSLAADYAASKAAVISVVRSAAVALAPAHIRVNAVCPGVIDTAMTSAIHEAHAAREGLTPAASLARMIPTIALRRVGSPSEVAGAIAFLLSEASAYVTGQAINVCGGNEFD